MTGTGNTARAAAVIAEELGAAGWEVHLREIGARVLGVPDGDETLVLCYPVLGFGMPGLVRKALRGVRGKGRLAAVYATWGGGAGAALLQGRMLLRRKGFRPVASGGTRFPFQWTQMFAPETGEEAQLTVDQGTTEARGFGKRLAAGAQGAPGRLAGGVRRFLAAVFWLPVSVPYAWIGRSMLGATYAADASCKACGVCQRQCPAGAIVITGSGPARRPRWRAACQGCNRCINLCPRGSVQESPLRVAVHLVLNVAVIVGLVSALTVAARYAAAVVPAAPPVVRTVAYVAVLIAMIVWGSRLQLLILEPALFALESVPAFRRLVGKSWTARFPRYRCPGFKPARSAPGAAQR